VSARIPPALARVLVLSAVLCGLVVVATLLGESGSPRLVRATGTALVMLVLVAGLAIFIGGSGVFSFGHLAFMGVGAYTTAIVTMSPAQKKFQLPGLPDALASLQLSGTAAALLSGAVAAVFAVLVSLPVLRLSGLTASLATVAILIAVHSVFQNWDAVTRGSAGIILDADPPTVHQLLLWACLAVVAAVVFRQSRAGMRLAASREDEIAARALGIRVWWERGLAFALSAFVVGVAGSLFARYFGSLNPESFYLTLTFTAIAMLVVGGLTSVSGAVVGTIVLSVALELLRAVERGVSIGGWEIPHRSGLTEVGLAVVLLVMLIALPAGITAGRELDPVAGYRAVTARRTARRAARAVEAPPSAPAAAAPSDTTPVAPPGPAAAAPSDTAPAPPA
jgi:branched-chain amino acid transport system permease protein